MKKTGYFILEVDENNSVSINDEMIAKLELQPGDKVEFSIKKIISKKEHNSKNENPLYELTK
jgi:cold shock CspA family protein